MKTARTLTLILLLATFKTQSSVADIIPSDRAINWTPGVTVGVQGTIPLRTNLINVTQAPYNADNTGAGDATLAIQSAINAAQSNDVVYLPTGKYRIASELYLNKSYVTLRGAGPTNSILVGITAQPVLKLGYDGPGPFGEDSWNISSSSKGSTNFTIATSAGFALGNPVQVGNIYGVSVHDVGNDSFNVMNVYGYDHDIIQSVVVTSVTNGTNITISDPLAWSFTNTPQLTELSYFGIPSIVPRQGIGLESFGITLTNNGHAGTSGFEIQAEQLVNCWLSNLDLGYANGYQIGMVGAMVNCTISGCNMHHALTSGTSHSGIIMYSAGSCLIENNIFSDGLGPGVEFNNGVMGCAFFGNFFTNNISDVDEHGPHPMMNLWEANVLGNFEMDGYFGSASHQTLFRNVVGSYFNPLIFNRWTTYMNVIGNILGTSSSTYSNYTSEVNGAGWMIIRLGFPNIGNNSYNDTVSPPVAWNFPGSSFVDLATGATRPNGIFTFTNSQVNTTNLTGNFTNIPAPYGITALMFQDPVNTNLYYPTNGVPIRAAAAGTSSNLLLTAPVTVGKGWTIYFVHPGAWQQLQQSNKYTDLITGNYDYFNYAVTWDTNGAQTIPDSLLYTSGAPSWWGTNRWPAIDPNNATLGAVIPAEERYLGIPIGNRPTPPSRLRVGP